MLDPKVMFLGDQIVKIKLIREHLNNNRHIVLHGSDPYSPEHSVRVDRVHAAIEALREANRQLMDLYCEAADKEKV